MRLPRRSTQGYRRLSRVGDTISEPTDQRVNRRFRRVADTVRADGRDRRPSARTTLWVPRHLVVRADPCMRHATRTATPGVTVRPRACLALPMDAIRA